MKLKYWVIILFISSTAIRLFFNFSQELIPGTNGGYYPLQVRSILLDGHLGFSDMPLLFYMDALIIKFISFFGFSITDSLILNVVKIIDSISLPLLLFPLSKIIRLTNFSKINHLSILAFSVLSFSPLILISDLQKNALAITFLFVSIANFFSFQVNKQKMHFFWASTFLILTGLTHFGTFIFGLLFLHSIILFIYRKKAIIPALIITALGLGIVFIIDVSRFNRLFSILSLVFEKPALLNGMLSLPDIFLIVFSVLLSAIGIIVIKRKRSELTINQKAYIFTCIICLVICSFPLLDGEYFKRLSLFLFIPQLLVFILIGSVMSVKRQTAIDIFLVVFTILSILAVARHPKEAAIDKNAYADLKNLQPALNINNKTIVIARHELEWWIAWSLKTKVAQDKSVDKSLFEKYTRIFVVNQLDGLGSDIEKSPFHEPLVPLNAIEVFSSEYFKAYKIK